MSAGAERHWWAARRTQQRRELWLLRNARDLERECDIAWQSVGREYRCGRTPLIQIKCTDSHVHTPGLELVRWDSLVNVHVPALKKKGKKAAYLLQNSRMTHFSFVGNLNIRAKLLLQ